VGGNDWVWKTGLNWQITPTVMVRSTLGTSYRAPGLFELFLGDQTGFLGQASIDPCIDWGESSNELIRQNCAAEGIPSDYNGAGSSAEIVSGGGAENLEPETSDAFTFGVVWTPEFSDLSIAVDYIDFTINNEIDQLGAGAIVSGCYNASNFPNAFCDLFTRAGPDGTGQNDPYNIISVNDTFINVNEQTYKGIDLNVLWNLDVDWGSIEFALQTTWNLENIQRTFDPALVEGFDTNDFVGSVGSPEMTTNFRTTFNWEDWRFNYFLQYIGETDDFDLLADEDDPDPAQTTYFGFDPAFVDLVMDDVFYHNVSVIYNQDNWSILFGINNLLDEEPDTVSAFARSFRGGNLPVAATQYDVFGRRYFLRFNWNL
jgi:iron complex outermembrane receptor protein